MKSRFTRDPREVNEYVAKLDPRRELVYRLALRGLCDRCRSDDAFTQRTSSRCGFRNDLGAVLSEAARLSRDLAGDG